MIQHPDNASEAERIRRLEEALADYAVRYGLTDRARAALKAPRPATGPSSGLARLLCSFAPLARTSRISRV